MYNYLKVFIIIVLFVIASAVDSLPYDANSSIDRGISIQNHNFTQI